MVIQPDTNHDHHEPRDAYFMRGEVVLMAEHSRGIDITEQINAWLRDMSDRVRVKEDSVSLTRSREGSTPVPISTFERGDEKPDVSFVTIFLDNGEQEDEIVIDVVNQINAGMRWSS